MKISSLFAKIKEKFSGLFKSGKKPIILMIAVIVIMVAIATSFFSPKGKSDNGVSDSTDFVSVTDYSESVEKKLQNMILKLEQVDNVSVLVVVDSTPKIEYLTEDEESTVTSSDGKSTTTTKKSQVVFDKDGSKSTAVVVTTIMPKVVGVLIVINKIDASTKINIINSISTVLNIDPSCISILQES